MGTPWAASGEGLNVTGLGRWPLVAATSCPQTGRLCPRCHGHAWSPRGELRLPLAAGHQPGRQSSSRHRVGGHGGHRSPVPFPGWGQGGRRGGLASAWVPPFRLPPPPRAFLGARVSGKWLRVALWPPVTWVALPAACPGNSSPASAGGTGWVVAGGCAKGPTAVTRRGIPAAACAKDACGTTGASCHPTVAPHGCRGALPGGARGGWPCPWPRLPHPALGSGG